MTDRNATSLTIEHRGETYPVFVDSAGRFTVEVADHWLSEDTYKELVRKVERLPRVKVDVPFVEVQIASRMSYSTNRRPVRASSTGIHADGDKALVRTAGSTRPSAVSKHSLQRVLTDLSEEEFAELERLCQAEIDASRAVDAFEKERKFDAWEATKAAVQAELARQGISDDDS
jgi:transposase